MALFRTAEIIKASKLPPEGVKLSRMIDAVYFLPIAYLGVFATFHMHFDLLAGDWDFWIDWKDRQFWVTVTPIVEVMYPGAIMYYFWTFYRQPFGATLSITGLLVGKWITIVFAWYWWANFPDELRHASHHGLQRIDPRLYPVADQELDAHSDIRSMGVRDDVLSDTIRPVRIQQATDGSGWSAALAGRLHGIHLCPDRNA